MTAGRMINGFGKDGSQGLEITRMEQTVEKEGPRREKEIKYS